MSRLEWRKPCGRNLTILSIGLLRKWAGDGWIAKDVADMATMEKELLHLVRSAVAYAHQTHEAKSEARIAK